MNLDRKELKSRPERYATLPRKVVSSAGNAAKFSEGDIIIAVKVGLANAKNSLYVRDMYTDEMEAVLEGARRYAESLEPTELRVGPKDTDRNIQFTL